MPLERASAIRDRAVRLTALTVAAHHQPPNTLMPRWLILAAFTWRAPG